MKCYEIQKFGVENLAVVDRPDPSPAKGEVLIEMRAASINYRDLMMVQGTYNPRLKTPLIPLSDGVGIVTAVGDGVSRVKVGERVAGNFSQKWIAGPATKDKISAPLGGPVDGMLTELRVLPEEGVVRVPAHLSDEEAASLPCAAVTAWSSVVEFGGVKAGDTVLIQGTGGVSIFTLQFSRMLGARVIVTSSSDAKIERALAMGASDGINYRTTPDWDKRAKELTGGVGVDHIVEVGGAGTLGKSMRAIRPGGTISIIGVLSGGASELSVVPILMQNLRLQGVLVGSR
ncbi:MAG: NAD(P)-dependent alcohol dehydrogenase, partial [Bryobacteraceae bacterium]